MGPMTNAERQRRYRQRLKRNPVKNEEQRKKNLERVKLRKVNIEQQNQNQKEKTRQKWRDYSARYYKKCKEKNGVPNAETRTSFDKTAEMWKLKATKLEKELKICKIALNRAVMKQEVMKNQINYLKKKIFSIKNLLNQLNEEQQSNTFDRTTVVSVETNEEDNNTSINANLTIPHPGMPPTPVESSSRDNSNGCVLT